MPFPKMSKFFTYTRVAIEAIRKEARVDARTAITRAGNTHFTSADAQHNDLPAARALMAFKPSAPLRDNGPLFRQKPANKSTTDKKKDDKPEDGKKKEDKKADKKADDDDKKGPGGDDDMPLLKSPAFEILMDANQRLAPYA